MCCGAAERTLVMYSTAPGKLAADGPAGGHGLLTAELLARIGNCKVPDAPLVVAHQNDADFSLPRAGRRSVATTNRQSD